MIEIVAIDTPSLRDRRYLVAHGEVARAVHPRRDIDRALALATERGVTAPDAFETTRTS